MEALHTLTYLNIALAVCEPTQKISTPKFVVIELIAKLVQYAAAMGFTGCSIRIVNAVRT